MAYKRVLINLPQELLDEVDHAAKREHRKRNEFVREALRDRIGVTSSDRTSFGEALARLRAEVKNDYPEDEIDRDIEQALAEVQGAPRKSEA